MKRDLSKPLAVTPPFNKNIEEQVKKNRKKRKETINQFRKEHTYIKVPGHQKGYVVKRDKPLGRKASKGVSVSPVKRLKKS